jgi:hypothetical protein
LQRQQAEEDQGRRRQQQEEMIRQQDQLQREITDRRAAQGRELDAALGGPVQRAVKDPSLSLAEMLRQAALVCAPAGADAVVHVDRFTEFDLVVSLRSLETPLVLAETARCVLSPCARYLNSLRFIYDTNVLLELDRGQIESVEDWTQVTRAQWLKLVRDPQSRRTSDTRPASTSATNDAPASVSPAGAPPDWGWAWWTGRPESGDGAAAGKPKPSGGLWARYEEQLIEQINATLRRLLPDTADPASTEALGAVTLKFKLHPNGRVTDVEVLKSEQGASRTALYARAVLNAGPYPAWTEAQRQAAGNRARECVVTGSRRLSIVPR